MKQNTSVRNNEIIIYRLIFHDGGQDYKITLEIKSTFLN